MDEVELTLERVIAIWWSLVWRATLGSMLLGMVLGGIGGFIVGTAGNPGLAPVVGGLLGWLGSVPVSMWALRATLKKKRGGYRIVLLKTP